MGGRKKLDEQLDSWNERASRLQGARASKSGIHSEANSTKRAVYHIRRQRTEGRHRQTQKTELTK